MKSLISVVSGVLITFSVSATDVSMVVPGAKDADGRDCQHLPRADSTLAV
ncbi:MAG: hypothetical protein FD131_831 [Rhodocyclaceae bacterium]|nr:MAG: hypothetical protein FD131_831 [Rhodocyclaceae bacterium]